MTNADQSGLHTPQDDIPLDITSTGHPDSSVDEVLAELFADNAAQTAYIDKTDLGGLAEPTMTDVYQGDADTEDRPDGQDTFDMLVERELRSGETEDSMEAVEEGMTYIPPVDPPISLDPQGTSGLDLDDPQDDDDLTANVRDALRADSSTVGLVDRLQIATINNIVVVRGEVDDLDDTDNIVAVISEIEGVEAVRDQTTVRGL